MITIGRPFLENNEQTKQTKIKEELRELKGNKKHNANLRTQILVHDSFNIVETTPMSSPSSISWDVSSQEIEEKKCNWCKIPFNCFETRKKRLKHIRNCKKSMINEEVGKLLLILMITNKVNRCLARYSPRAKTTNRSFNSNRAPNKPAWPGPI